ncbi:MAG: hypothetical protein IPP69_11460 [Flavobacteriales bacterium]|nr:hypothetical protein [Flavobacteriales bacterium]
MKTTEELEKEVEKLFIIQSRIRNSAFITAIGGLLFFIFGLYWKYLHPEWNLEDMGSYIAGGAGAAWGFSGLLFIYLGFLGQKQEIKNQQIELILTRDEMKASRVELKGQKEQLEAQKTR